MSTGDFDADQDTADELEAAPEEGEMPDVAGPVASDVAPEGGGAGAPPTGSGF